MPNERPARPQFELMFPGTTLAAFTRTDGGMTRKFIGGTASSTAEDLKGSIIGEKCQAKMMDKLNALASRMTERQSGMTAWVNHEYTIPEDVLGAFTGAKLVQRTGEDGKQYVDLDIECRVTEENPRAVMAWNQVNDGIRHGWSIGAYFTDIEWLSDDPKSPDFLKYRVLDIDLLEVSLVGIPANQRAWVRDAETAQDNAVKISERITNEAHGALHRRSLVQRAIIEQRTPSGAERLAIAQDFRERSQQPHLDEANVAVFTRVADFLEKRDDGSDMSPDDARDKVGLAISHIAKAVGHGMCVKSAGHVARAIDCMSAVMGADGGTGGGPGGETDPNGQMAEGGLLAKLSPKDGDLIVWTGATADQLDALRALWPEDGAKIQLMSIPEGNTIDTVDEEKRAALEVLTQSIADETARKAKLEADIAALVEAESKRVADALAASTEASAAVDASKAELAATQTATEAAKAELAALEATIAEKKAERLGRLSQTRSTMDSIADSQKGILTAEHYKLSDAELHDATVRFAKGNTPAPDGRDIAVK